MNKIFISTSTINKIARKINAKYDIIKFYKLVGITESISIIEEEIRAFKKLYDILDSMTKDYRDFDYFELDKQKSYDSLNNTNAHFNLFLSL
jgi:hypothetical protein